LPTDAPTHRDRGFDEWLEDVGTMAALGYRPLLVVLRDEQGGMEVHSPALGPELATVISSLAQDIETGPPVASPGTRAESGALEDDDSATAFTELLEARRTDGFLPCFLLFVNDTGHCHSLADIEPEELVGFLRWLSFEVAETGDESGSVTEQ